MTWRKKSVPFHGGKGFQSLIEGPVLTSLKGLMAKDAWTTESRKDFS